MIKFIKSLFKTEQLTKVEVKTFPNEFGFNGRIECGTYKIILRRGHKEDFISYFENIRNNELIYLDDVRKLFYKNRDGELFHLKFEKINVNVNDL